MFGPPPVGMNPYNRPGTGVPYNPQGYGSAPSYAPTAPASDSSRTVKVVFGVLCLIASIILAVLAIILAL
jgi:hypothetical protein